GDFPLIDGKLLLLFQQIQHACALPAPVRRRQQARHANGRATAALLSRPLCCGYRAKAPFPRPPIKIGRPPVPPVRLPAFCSGRITPPSYIVLLYQICENVKQGAEQLFRKERRGARPTSIRRDLATSLT